MKGGLPFLRFPKKTPSSSKRVVEVGGERGGRVLFFPGGCLGGKGGGRGWGGAPRGVWGGPWGAPGLGAVKRGGAGANSPPNTPTTLFLPRAPGGPGARVGAPFQPRYPKKTLLVKKFFPGLFVKKSF